MSFKVYTDRWRPYLAAAAITQLPVLVPTLIVVRMLLDATVHLLLARMTQVLLSPLPAIGVTMLFYALRDGEQSWRRLEDL